MNNYQLRHSILALLCFFSLGSYAQIPTSGLVAHWDMNGNANDVSGNGHHGVTSNTTATTGHSGLANTALAFNGTSSYITVPYASDLNVTSYTICATVKFTGFDLTNCQSNRLLTRGIPPASGYYFAEICNNGFDSTCSVTGDTSNYVLQTLIQGRDQNHYKNWQYLPTTRTNRWYCMVVSYNGTELKFYVDGMLVNRFTPKTVSPIGTSTQGLYIGAEYISPGNLVHQLKGSLDDLALYNRALSDSEIVNHYCGVTMPDTTVSITNPITDTLLCAGDSLRVNYTVSPSFKPGNTFTLQLSDAAGSFAIPVTLRTITAMGSGNINCTIPSGTAAGNGYRVRIVATSPYYISLINTNNIRVKAGPGATTVGSNSPLCAGSTLSLTAAGTATSYAWNGPIGYAASVQNPSVPNAQPLNSGWYYVTASLNGCTRKDSTKVTVNAGATPTVSAYASPGDTICSGSQLTLVAIPTATGTVSYQWYKNGTPIPGATNSTYTPSVVSVENGDVYYCIITTTGGCNTPNTATSNNVKITIVSSLVPVVHISVSPDSNVWAGLYVTFTATPANGGTTPVYQWKRNGQDIVGAISATWGANNLDDGDVISCFLYSSLDCARPDSAISNKITMHIPEGINSVRNIHAFNLQPNPNDGNFSISGYAATAATYQLRIVNTLGQIVHSQKLDMPAGAFTSYVTTDKLAAGTYIIELSSPQGTAEHLRFIRQ